MKSKSMLLPANLIKIRHFTLSKVLFSCALSNKLALLCKIIGQFGLKRQHSDHYKLQTMNDQIALYDNVAWWRRISR